MSLKMIAAFTVAASMALGSAVYAHPALKSTNPAANGTVSPALKEIRFDFSESVIPAFSGAKLTDPKGNAVPTGTPRLDAKSKKELIVPLKESLKVGKYKLAWYAVASDTHRVTGSYAFTVKK